jgi:DNA-binding MarR family transcriptional regulator
MNDFMAAAHPPHAKQALRLWLRMLATTTLVEKAIRSHLRQSCDSTLPRFDVMAALDRASEKLTMSELSDRLLVSNGNVTGVVARLVEDGLVSREVDPTDRRTQRVSLTPTGRKAFRRMASEHEKLIDSVFCELSDEEIVSLLHLISALQKSVHERLRPKLNS